MIKRIWCWLTGGELVWLKDHDGEVTLAIARVDAWGERTAERHWPMKIRTVRLLEDGTVDGVYVKFWKPANAMLSRRTGGRAEKNKTADPVRSA